MYSEYECYWWSFLLGLFICVLIKFYLLLMLFFVFIFVQGIWLLFYGGFIFIEYVGLYILYLPKIVWFSKKKNKLYLFL